MGANLTVNESIDDQVPGAPEGYAELVQGVFLQHAGKIPDEHRAQIGRYVCQATDILPDTPAEAAGMHDGDDFFTIDGEPVVGSEDPCPGVLEKLRGAPGTTKRIRVLRDGDVV